MATDGGSTKRRRVTPVAMVLHLDEEEDEEDVDGDGEDDGEDFTAAPDSSQNRQSVAIDVEGRVGGVSDCGLDFSFRSYPDESFQRYAGLTTTKACDVIADDCKKCFVGESFWLAAGSKPRCVLEELARRVFELHVAGTDGTWDVDKSGAEWWVQVRREGDGHNETVSFHWDKDEDLVDGFGVNVHPAISTVTYVTESGAPTLVLDHVPPVMYEDVEQFRGAIGTGYLSFPKRGKHVAFDGRLLHGAPRELAKTRHVQKGYERVSFLVNIWLNYRPYAIEPFPEEEIENLGLSPVNAIPSALPGGFPKGFGGDAYPSTSSRTDRFGDMREFRYDFGATGVEHKLVLPVSIELLDSVSDAREGKVVGGRKVDCVRLRFARGAEAAVVAQEPKEPRRSGRHR